MVPDVASLDIKMPVLDGISTTGVITADTRLNGVRVVVLTNYDLDAHVYSALREGACGFLVKDLQPTELLHAL